MLGSAGEVADVFLAGFALQCFIINQLLASWFILPKGFMSVSVAIVVIASLSLAERSLSFY